MPARHHLQAPPAAEYVPAGHCAQLFLSAVEVSPALQSLQTLHPAVLLYLPAGQDVQAPPAAEFLYLPAGQGVLQELLPAEPGGDVLPAAQDVQEAVPPFEYVPEGQVVHVDRPGPGVCVPAGQFLQEGDASVSLIVPAGQDVHEVAPASEYTPAPQGMQAVISPRPALLE